MSTCKTCKHFSQFKDDNYLGKSPYGVCGRWNEGYSYDRDNMPLNEVLVENDEGWAAIMGPDFGCILHEVA